MMWVNVVVTLYLLMILSLSFGSIVGDDYCSLCIIIILKKTKVVGIRSRFKLMEIQYCLYLAIRSRRISFFVFLSSLYLSTSSISPLEWCYYRTDERFLKERSKNLINAKVS